MSRKTTASERPRPCATRLVRHRPVAFSAAAGMSAAADVVIHHENPQRLVNGLRRSDCAQISLRAARAVRRIGRLRTASRHVVVVARRRLTRRVPIARVAADPPPVPGAERPGGWPGAVNYRLHGSPPQYWSKDNSAGLAKLADGFLEATAASVESWCVLDNMASVAALENACASSLNSCTHNGNASPGARPICCLQQHRSFPIQRGLEVSFCSGSHASAVTTAPRPESQSGESART